MLERLTFLHPLLRKADRLVLQVKLDTGPWQDYYWDNSAAARNFEMAENQAKRFSGKFAPAVRMSDGRGGTVLCEPDQVRIVVRNPLLRRSDDSRVVWSSAKSSAD